MWEGRGSLYFGKYSPETFKDNSFYFFTDSERSHVSLPRCKGGWDSE